MSSHYVPLCGFLVAGVALLVSTGCDRNTNEPSAETSPNHTEQAGHGEPAGANHHDEGGGEESVTYKEGRGLQFSEDVLRALSLKTADVTERPVAGELRATAQIFATTPRVLAGAHVAESQISSFEKATAPGVKLVRADRSATRATRLAELVFELENITPSPEIGSFVKLTLTAPSVTVPSVPRSAVIDGATGAFVYVVNGGAYLRTPVKLGAHSSEYVEITDGLYPGDVVVTTQVGQLWLTELRLTKGGGHCD